MLAFASFVVELVCLTDVLCLVYLVTGMFYNFYNWYVLYLI